jgi:hypothetical protein
MLQVMKWAWAKLPGVFAYVLAALVGIVRQSCWLAPWPQRFAGGAGD